MSGTVQRALRAEAGSTRHGAMESCRDVLAALAPIIMSTPVSGPPGRHDIDGDHVVAMSSERAGWLDVSVVHLPTFCRRRASNDCSARRRDRGGLV
jgi:hypothetical protein